MENGDFNARVGKAVDDNDVISRFGEGTCNASGNNLSSSPFCIKWNWLHVISVRTRVNFG